MTRFSHTFANGITGTMTFDPVTDYSPQERRVSPSKHWTRQPTDQELDAMLPEYKAWAHFAHSEIAAIVQAPIAHLLQDSDNPASWELWIYQPDGTRDQAEWPPQP